MAAQPSAAHPTHDRPARVARPVIRGVILDVDGTLLDSNRAHAEAWVQALAEGGRSIRYDQVLPLIGMGADKVLPTLTGIEGHGPTADLINARRKAYFLDKLPLLAPQAGARHLVQMVRDHRQAVSIASSATADELRQLLLAADVADLVGDIVVSGDAAAESKPDPDIVREALRRLRLPPDAVLMIGDTPYDIEAARALGIGTIAVRCGGWSSQELANALAIYDSPQDLVNDYEASPLRSRA